MSGFTDLDAIKRMIKSPLLFIKMMWGLEPQPVRKSDADYVERCIKEGRWNDINANHFNKFYKGKHITWQQYLILKAVESSDGGKKRISIRSGHGIGKTAVLSWLLLWYLFCHKEAQVPCTAPTSDQMYDVLWKEIAKWLNCMPEPIQKKFEWSTSYVRVTEKPETWFARAKTARKETPEALAGVHGDYVMFLIDEASGVPEEVYNVAEGALTGENVLVVMISNPTRTTGYFYESHRPNNKLWHGLHFNSLDSPIVDNEFVQRIKEKHGDDSDEYRIRVMGDFPRIEGLDDRGYSPLFVEADLKEAETTDLVGATRMGIDPAGEGDNETIWVIRDQFKARIVGRESTSNVKSITEKTLTLSSVYNIDLEDIFIDNFGVGANVAQEIALASKKRVEGVNVGNSADDQEIFRNKRAEAYWRVREWLNKGARLYEPDKWKQLLDIKYKRNISGKIQIMTKDEMRSMGIKSPDIADALMLTFTKEILPDTPGMNDWAYTPTYTY